MKKTIRFFILGLVVLLALTACSSTKTNTPSLRINGKTVSFDLAGGSFAEGELQRSVSETKNEEVVLPKAERAGCVFAGWLEIGSENANPIFSIVSEEVTSSKLYTAQWQLIEYKVTFVSKLVAGASGEVNDLPKFLDTSYTVETETTLEALENRPGYDFVGWMEEGADESSAVKTAQLAKGTTGDKTVVVLWKPSTYTINIDLDGGEFETAEGSEATAEVKTEYSYKSQEVIEIPNPVKAGYNFLNWSYEEGTVTEVKEASIVLNTQYQGNIELKANWQVIEYPITYYEYGLIIDDLSQSVESVPEETSEEPLAVAEPEVTEVLSNPDYYTIDEDVSFINPTREGYTFLGWVEKPEGEIDISKLTPDTVLAVTDPNYSIKMGTVGDKELVAIWSRNLHFLSYDLNNGSLEETNPAEFIYGQESFELKAPTREFYEFEGWKDLESGAIYNLSFDNTFQDKDLVLTAQWAPVQYAINYMLEGGKFEGEYPAFYTYETETFTLPIPVRTGYTFLGWTDETAEVPVEEITIYQGSVGEKAYTANWQINIYTIDYATEEQYGPRFEPEVVVYQYPTTYTAEEVVEIKNLEKIGFDFMGWVLEDQEYTEAKTDLVLEKGSVGDRVYVPLFKIHNYSVVLELDDGALINEIPNTFTFEDADFTVGAAEKENYIFLGWLCEDGEIRSEVTVECAKAQDVVLKAVWQPIEYTISYDFAGGKEVANVTTYTVETEPFALNSSIKDTYEFAGWKVKGQEGDPTFTFDTSKGGNVELVATWKEQEYNIFYALSGGAFEYADSNPYIFTNYTEEFSLEAPTKTGYTFLGWVEVGKEKNRPVVDYVIKTSELRNDVYLKAIWKACTYSINYNLNGGYFYRGATLNATNYTIEDRAFILSNPIRDGFEFLGWVRSEYSSTDRPTMVLRVDTSAGGDLSYDALWKANSYTITYNLDGGSYKYGNSNPATYTADSSFTLANPHKDGYTFLGWVQSGDPLEAVNQTVSIGPGTTGNLTFYAIYEQTLVAVGEVTKQQTEIIELGKNDIPRPDWVIKAPEAADYHYEKAYASGGDLISNLEKASAKCREYLAAYLSTEVSTVSKSVNGVAYSTLSTEVNTSVRLSEMVEYWEDANGGVWVLMRIGK